MNSNGLKRFGNGRSWGYGVVVGLAGLVSVGLTGCERETAAPAFERPPAPVTVASAVTEDVPVYLDEIGKCVPRETVSIQPQVSGRITQIHFTDGADLHRGDLLFTIDPRPFQAQLDQAEASLAQATSALGLAKTELARYGDRKSVV